jgi:hypothetical protein
MTLYQWAKRYAWDEIPRHAQALDASLIVKNDSASAHKAVMEAISREAMRGSAVTALRAFNHAGTLPDEALLDRDRAAALENHSRIADRSCGWTAARQQPAQVQVAVVLPTEAERDELRGRHATLDAITAKLALKAKTISE